MGNAQPVPLIASPFPNVGEMPVTWGIDKNTRLAEHHKAIVDLNTGKLYSIVSRDYRLIRHEEAIKEVDDEVYRIKGLGKHEAITEFFNGGGCMRRTYRFEDISVEVKKGDFINLELHLFNSYDRTWPFIVLLGAFRLVCENGLVVGKKYLHLRRRHVYELGQIKVSEEVGTALNRFRAQARQWKGWSKRRLTRSGYIKVLEIRKLGAKAMDRIEQRMIQEAEGFDSDNFPVLSLWGFFNIMTWHVSHNTVSLNHRVELEERLRKALVHFRSA